MLYHAPERRPLQDVLTCIREKTTLASRRQAARSQCRAASENRRRRWRACSRDYPEAIAETLRVLGAPRLLPRRAALRISATSRPATSPRPQEALARLAWEGAALPLSRTACRSSVTTTLEHELAIIEELPATRPISSPSTTSSASPARKDILCQGRGSAANSAVCYCLGITEVDPEPRQPALRALHLAGAQRAARHRRRFRARAARGGDAVHLREIRPRPRRHRRHRHHLPLALGRARGRQGLRPLGGRRRRARRRPSGAGRRTACATPTSAAPASIRQSRRMRAGARPVAARSIGFPRHLSQHVGGFVITRDRLDEMVPIMNAAMDDRTIIEWDKDDLDALEHAEGRRARARHADLHPPRLRFHRRRITARRSTLAIDPGRGSRRLSHALPRRYRSASSRSRAARR